MTDLKKEVSRRTVSEHTRHKRRIVATLAPGDVISLRLERSSQAFALPLERVFDFAETTHAKALVNMK